LPTNTIYQLLRRNIPKVAQNELLFSNLLESPKLMIVDSNITFRKIMRKVCLL